MKTYGYARVSAKDQNLTRQLKSFIQFGITLTFICGLFSIKYKEKSPKRAFFFKIGCFFVSY